MIKNELMMIARNAMADANAANQLSLLRPAKNLDEILQARSGEYAGDALYRRVIDDVKTDLDVGGLCFRAGTLIHTKEGLKPIEDIKIGDWVLSQPETKGELVYKRVTQTMQFDAPVMLLKCQLFSGGINESYGNKIEHLVVTPNHPFYVTGFVEGRIDPDATEEEISYWMGWQQAKNLQPYSLLELANGEVAYVIQINYVWRTKTEGVGWIGLAEDSCDGYLVDLRKDEIHTDWDNLVVSDLYIDETDFRSRYGYKEGIADWAYHCPVYNFEVEDFHTYYVSDLGIWVHNSCYETLHQPRNQVFYEQTEINHLGGIQILNTFQRRCS